LTAAARPASTPTFFSVGLRPFFLAGAVWAALSVPIWAATSVFDDATFDRDWHIHEMLFGFLAAIVAGFLLTAVPNWTRRPGVTGLPLAGLLLLWSAGRLAMLWTSAIGPAAAAAIDCLFLPVLALVIGRDIIAAKNWSNLGVCALVGALAVANVAFHARMASADGGLLGERGALAAGAMLIMVIGGRVTPNFTRNWLSRRGARPLPARPGSLDTAALVASSAALALWVCLPAHAVSGAGLLLAAGLGLLRLSRWSGPRCLAEPLVWVLHVGYFWLCVGLALLGMSAIAPQLIPLSAGIHALTTGAVGVMTLAMMTRASLGHTGRPLTAGPPTTAIYAVINVAAVLRVAAAIAGGSGLILGLAAFAWTAAFGLFAIIYGPFLTAPRK
jgi:uncharacterized protein involved in response to NO